MATCITKKTENLIDRAHIVDKLSYGRSRRPHLGMCGVLKENDLLIFPEHCTIYEYEDTNYNPNDTYTPKFYFVVCKLLRFNGEVRDYYYYPCDLTEIFYKPYYEYGRYYADTETRYCHKINGENAFDWINNYVFGKQKFGTDFLLTPFEGKTILISNVQTHECYRGIWRNGDIRGGKITNDILSFTILDKENADQLISEHQKKQDLYNKKQRVEDIKRLYTFGYKDFIGRYNLVDTQLTNDVCEQIINNESQIQFNDYKHKAEDIMINNPWGMRIVYKDRILDAHSLAGYQDILSKEYQIHQEQNRYIELQRIKTLEPKYANSPFLEHVTKCMDRIKPNYFAECTMVDILFNISMSNDVIAVFGKSISEIVEHEFQDTYAYRTNLHYRPGFLLTYEDGIIRENLIRKIIDHIEKELKHK